jgi:hypothetical protein
MACLLTSPPMPRSRQAPRIINGHLGSHSLCLVYQALLCCPSPSLSPLQHSTLCPTAASSSAPLTPVSLSHASCTSSQWHAHCATAIAPLTSPPAHHNTHTPSIHIRCPQTSACVAALCVVAAAMPCRPSESPRDLQRRRLLEAKAALGPGSTCFLDWNNDSYPCDGDASTWGRVCGCSNSMVTKLCLFGCGFGGTLPASLGNLPALQELYLYSNQLSGPLPASWGNLNRLTRLDLDNNQLTGQLPESWGSLAALDTLYLNGNTGLNGTLPCSWKSMGSLTKLFLQNTGLTGCYPSEALQTAGAAGTLIGVPPTNVNGVRGEWCSHAGRGASVHSSWQGAPWVGWVGSGDRGIRGQLIGMQGVYRAGPRSDPWHGGGGISSRLVS